VVKSPTSAAIGEHLVALGCSSCFPLCSLDKLVQT
jgi:hypothetical protein